MVETGQESPQRKEFIGECKTLCKLEPHLHTVTCYHVSALDGLPLLFTEYVSGGELHKELEEGRLRDRKTASDVAIQIARGMDFAHSKGLIHWDLEPANVLMTPDGTAKVADFGLARHGTARGESADGVLVSLSVSTGSDTPGYGAPEQWSRGKLFDGRADIFAFGVLLWRLLGGRMTWADQGRNSVIAHHADRELLKRGEVASLPESLTDAILRCLEPDPMDRWDGFPAIIERLIAVYAELTKDVSLRTSPVGGTRTADELNNLGVSLANLDRLDEPERYFVAALKAQPRHRDRPATRADVEHFVNRSSRRAGAEQLPHLVFLFSLTGWTAEARNFVTGQDDSAFCDPLVSLILFDENGRRATSE